MPYHVDSIWLEPILSYNRSKALLQIMLDLFSEEPVKL